MNFRALMLAPWRCAHAGMRWVTLSVLLLATCAGIAVTLFRHPPGWPWVAVELYGAGLVYLWAFYLSSLVLLAIDARQLRLPGMQRTVVGALLVYAALSVVPATLLGGLFGGDMPAIALLLTLLVLAGLSFALLPRYCAVVIGFLPALYNATATTWPVPGPSDPRFLSWMPLVAVALVLLCVLRWNKLVGSDHAKSGGLGAAMVLQYRRGAWGNGWSGAGIDSTQQVRQRPDWMQPQVDLRRAGPQQPRIALRVALGGSYLPKTLMGYLRVLAPVLLIVLVPVAVLALGFGRMHLVSGGFIWIAVAVGIGWGCLYGGMGVVIATVTLLTQRWRKANAELPLLALLPGLGDDAQAKRQLLRVSLLRPLVVQGVLCVVLLAMAIYTHMSTPSLLLIALSQLGSALCLVACLLCIVGGRPLSGWALGGVMTALGILVGSLSYLPGSMISRVPWTPPPLYMAIVLAAWAVLGIVLLWLLRRGLQAWRARPHAFMPNA